MSERAREDCPARRQLDAYHGRLLPWRAAEAIRDHLADCPVCCTYILALPRLTVADRFGAWVARIIDWIDQRRTP